MNKSGIGSHKFRREIWCYNQTAHAAMVLSVSGATALPDGSISRGQHCQTAAPVQFDENVFQPKMGEEVAP